MLPRHFTLRQSLRATLLWFALLGRSLKLSELKNYLFRHTLGARNFLLPKDAEVLKTGEYLVLARKNKNDLAATPSQSINGGIYSAAQLVKKFRTNAPLRDKFLRRANFAARLLAKLPFVRFVGLINSLAMSDLDTESDIDLIVITAPRRLYFVRTLAIILLKLLGLKKTRRKIFGRICLGYFLTEETLDFQKEKIPGDLIFLSFWLASMRPLAGNLAVYQKLIEANLKFIQRNLPNFSPRTKKIPSFPRWQSWGEFLLRGCFGDWLEKNLARIHIAHTWRLPENHLPSSTTVANEKILKLHAVDNTRELRLRWEKIIERK